MAYAVMAYAVMTYVVMAYVVMTYVVMADIVCRCAGLALGCVGLYKHGRYIHGLQLWPM